jgi:lipid-A-disaccharide synthase
MSQIRIFIIAGEASGDSLGASLMRGLKELRPDIEFRGVGGREMEGEGLKSLFPMQELSVMGLAEVLPSLPRILKRMSQTIKAVLDFRPQALITIDSPDFCFRVAKKIKARSKDIRCIHYVAPSVWAWRPGRAKKVAGFLDHLLTLLPFEPPYFEEHGLKATFVGHPIIERLSHRGDGERFRKAHGLTVSQPLLCLLPGSRMTELNRLLDKFGETAAALLRDRHSLGIVIPTLPHLKGHIEKFFVGKGINPVVIDDMNEKFDCFSATTVALAASGTVSLELALCDAPHIIAYDLGRMSTWIAKRAIRTQWVNLVNIILQRPAVPELLLENCQPGRMVVEAGRLLDDREARAGQLTAFREALIKLGLGDPKTPGQKGAEAVLMEIGQQPASNASFQG